MSGSSITLSASVQKDLLLFNDSKTALPVETVEILTQEICLKIVKMPSTDSRMEQLERNVPNLLQLYTSLFTFILEAASENLPLSEIEAILKTFNWSANQISQFSKTYSENQLKIQATLKLFGNSPPKLVDANWRLDYEIESNTKGPVKSLLYIIDLVLDNNGVNETLKFTATHAELEDLVTTLKDACNSIKRVASF